MVTRLKEPCVETIRSKNKISYRETVYIDGVRHRSPTFDKKTDAKNWKNELLSQREKAKILGDQFKVVEKQKFLGFAENWVETKIKPQRSSSTYNRYSNVIKNHFSSRFKDFYLDELKPSHADELVKSLLEKGHVHKGVNDILQIFKSIFIEAKKKKAIRENPFEDYASLKEIQMPPSYWNANEINQFLLTALEHHLYPVFVTALNTGMRRGELGGLGWDMVDFGRNMIQVSRIRDRYGLRRTTKTGVARHIPMNPVVRTILLNLYHRRTDKTICMDIKGKPVHLVFGNAEGAIMNIHHLYRDFQRAQKRAKMSQIIRFHDLRHTFASHFMMNGGNIYDLQKVLGHTKTEMTQIYAHLAPEHLAGVTSVVNFGDPLSKKVAQIQPNGLLEVI